MYQLTGLGLNAFAIPADVEGGLQILQGMIFHWADRVKKMSVPNATLLARVEGGAKFWAAGSEAANFAGDFSRARSETARGIAYMQQVAPLVMKAEGMLSTTMNAPTVFSPKVGAEVDRLERGSSFVEQVKQTLGASQITEAIASTVTPLSPALAATIRGSSWVVPALIAGGAILLLRRR